MTKRINWPAIKKRYLQGERPSQIARDYINLTGVQISSKASASGWPDCKKAILKEVESMVRHELIHYKAKGLGLACDLLEKFIHSVEAHAVFLPEKSNFNPMIKIAFSEALKVTIPKEEKDETDNGPRFIYLPGINPDSV